MKVEVIEYVDNWMKIKRCTMNTIGKDSTIYPDSEYKAKLLRSEHSPIRLGTMTVKCTDVPTFVVNHLVRHHIGIEKFVRSMRSDRGADVVADRNTPIDVIFDINFQAFINISRVRLCNCASKETRQLWRMILDEVAKYEPELVALCVPNCIYKGYCHEFFKCGYANKPKFLDRILEYRTYNGEQL